MGGPRQRWTPAEESALQAGVTKHGAGNWQKILRDPEFSGVLKNRSNVDLKDKWRNMSGCVSRKKSTVVKRNENPNTRLKQSYPRLNALIIEAISGLKEPGSSNDMTNISKEGSTSPHCNKLPDLNVAASIEEETDGCSNTALGSATDREHVNGSGGVAAEKSAAENASGQEKPPFQP